MLDEDTIRKRIEQLQEEREKFIAQANQTIAAYDGAIGELTRLISEEVKRDDLSTT